MAQDTDDELVEYLFVQNAEWAALADGVLRLGGISSSTLYFSDRPERIAGHMTTAAFVDLWAEGRDSFKSDPPNAALSAPIGDELQEVVVVLEEPKLEATDLVYQVEVLEGEETLAGGPGSLFIDMSGNPLSPTSVVGVHRRRRRRRRHIHNN